MSSLPTSPTPPPTAQGGGARKSFWGSLTQPTSWANILIVVAVVIFFVWVGRALLGEGEFAVRLKDQDFARGVITFTVTFGTVILGFVLVIHSLLGEKEPQDDRFRRAREVFAGLMGVLGTIVGFYFGAFDKGVLGLQLSEVQVVETTAGREVITQATGGVPPYRYAIRVGGKEVADKRSESGWVREPLPKDVSADAEIVVEVTDGAGRKAARTRPAAKAPVTSATGTSGTAK